MDILAEIIVWSVLGLAITIALAMSLPAFLRALRTDGADVFPTFLRGATTPVASHPTGKSGVERRRTPSSNPSA